MATVSDLTPPSLIECAHRLTYGEWAVALYASDVPDKPAEDVALAGDAQSLAAFAAQGVERLGGVAKVTAQHRAWLALNQRFLDGSMPGMAYEEAVRGMWPDTNRLERCLAYDFRRLR